MTLNHIFSFYEPASSLIKHGWWALCHGIVLKDNDCRKPERARGCLEPHHKRVSKMLGDARPLCTPSGLFWVWTPVWGLVLYVAEHSRDFWAGLGPTWWFPWPQPPLHRALICPFSPFPQTNLSFSWKVPVSSPPPCLSPGLSPETPASLPHRSKLFSTGGSESRMATPGSGWYRWEPCCDQHSEAKSSGPSSA